MKSIAFFSNLFPPVATGSSTQSFALARELSKKGLNVIVITPRLDEATPAVETIHGFKIYRIPCFKLPKLKIALNFPWLNATMSFLNILRIQKILRENNVELIHVHNHMFDLALMAHLMKFLMKIPTVVTIHTMIKHGNPFFNAILYPLDRFFLKFFVISRANSIICPDVNMDKYMRDRFNRHDCTIIPYGITLPEYPGEKVKQEIIQKFNLQNRRVILSLGHVHVLRNRLELIRALKIVKEQCPEILLLIVGDVMDERPVQLVKELGLENNVLFTGVQPHHLVPVFHEIAEFEAMWLDQEDSGQNSLGIACMEGMLAGKPVCTVSNENTFGPGILKDGENVIILKANNIELLAQRLTHLLMDKKNSEKIGLKAKEIASKHFAWEGVAEKTKTLYAKTVLTNKAITSNVEQVHPHK